MIINGEPLFEGDYVSRMARIEGLYYRREEKIELKECEAAWMAGQRLTPKAIKREYIERVN